MACSQALRWEDGQRTASAAGDWTWSSWGAMVAAATELPPPTPESYVVERGDTLYSIAFRYSLDWRTIAAWNGLGNSDLIFPGQRLRLQPPSGVQLAQTATPAPTQTPPAPGSSSTPSGNGAPPSSPAPTAPPASPAPTPAPTAPAPTPTPTPTLPAPTPPPASTNGAIQWGWPTQGSVVYLFGDAGALGNGLGVTGTLGQPVQATAAGSVVYTGRGLIGYGELVIVKHDDTYLSAYGHTQDIQVRQGDEVRAGQTLASMGQGPGQRPLLHFEIRVNGQAVDPLGILPSR